jgi:hypothetical protein
MTDIKSSKAVRDVHLTKSLGGEDPYEIHKAILNKRCTACGMSADTTLKLFAPLNELKVDALAFIAAQLGSTKIPVVETKSGKYVRVSTAYACARCAPEAERVAAKHPSSWFVDIERAPREARSYALR